MFATFLFVAAAVITDATEAQNAGVRAQYEAAKARTGRDADAQVGLSLWCEAHGLKAERIKHLALALIADPNNARARAFLGLLSVGNRWLSPEEAAKAIKSDQSLTAKLAAYNAKRERLRAELAPGGQRPRARARAAQTHVALGMWCEQNGLKAEATAHFTSAVVLTPYRDATWKHLGYIKNHGRWMNRGQIEAQKAEAEVQKKADAVWMKRLTALRRDRADKRRSGEAELRLTEVTDPRAIPSIVRVFVSESALDQLVAVKLLEQIDTPESSRELAIIAFTTQSDPVITRAVEALRTRSPREYAGMLVEQVRAPWTYSVVPVAGPGSPGQIEVNSPRFRWVRRYDAPRAFAIGSFTFYGYAGYDGNGLPVVISGIDLRRMANESLGKQLIDLAKFEAETAEMIAQARLKAADSQQRLLADLREIQEFNLKSEVLNERVERILGGVGVPIAPTPTAVATGKGGADEPAQDASVAVPASAVADHEFDNIEDQWKKWWYDQLGYRYTPPPQVTVTVDASPQSETPLIVSCFAAGTPVRTRDGLRPIETLQVGDHVLSQDTVTGSLSFQTISVVHHNPPGKILAVALDNGETISASIFHRFWRAGVGWAQARHLKPGDQLRLLQGSARVLSVTEKPAVPVYNLDVAGSRTYFVGKYNVLVHDNTLPELRHTPFDAVPSLDPE